MCQFPLSREQALKYFNEGKTDLIDKFVSKKGRPFSARLVCNTEGKMMLGWDFPEREAKLDADGKPIPPARKRTGPPRRDFTAKKAPAKKAARKK
jgi:DNA topoisomerase-3